MGEKQFIWDEILDGLTLLGTQKAEEEQIKRQKKKSADKAPKVYCPHGYLILNFHETLNQGEKIRYRKYFLRKVSPNEPDVIILQDIKDLLMFLLSTPVSPQFINFFHLPIVDRFLRALILYFQYYVTIWEDLMHERAAALKKAPNPLAQGYRSRYMDEMQNLRCVLGREYADLLVGCQDASQYHHMVAGKNGVSTVTQSQGEKDLRIYEVLICMAHRVVWIALQRKYFNLIEVELHRLFRTDSYNTAKRRGVGQVAHDLLEDDMRVLHGPEIQAKRKLLRNSPLIQELVFSSCDYRLLTLGIEDSGRKNPRIIYLQNALLVEEEKLPTLGIKMGILGHQRSAYDVLLMVQEEKEEKKSIIGSIHSQLSETPVPEVKRKRSSMPLLAGKFNLSRKFPVKSIDISPRGYKNDREESRKKWLYREINRRTKNGLDTYSTGTSID